METLDLSINLKYILDNFYIGDFIKVNTLKTLECGTPPYLMKLTFIELNYLKGSVLTKVGTSYMYKQLYLYYDNILTIEKLTAMDKLLYV